MRVHPKYSQVALDHDDNLAVLELGNELDLGDVLSDEGKLLLGF